MTDERTETESQPNTDRPSSGPDGFVIIHRPKDETVTPYGIGPFPPIEGLDEKVIAAKGCDCECMALYIAFPKGLKMMLVVDEDSAPAMALVSLMAALGVITDDDGPVH